LFKKSKSLLNSKDLARSIHSSLIFFQYRNDFLGSAYQQPISLHQSHILIEIAAQPGVTARQLIDLGLGSQVMIARRIAELLELGFLRSEVSANDARKQLLNLTSSGREVLKKLDARSNSLKEIFGEGFAEAELIKLASLINHLCDAAGIPASSALRAEPALRPAFRRLARFMGVIGSNFMNSQLSSSEWQILQAIRYSPDAVSANVLVTLLKMEQSVLSRTLGVFIKNGLIAERVDAKDARRKVLSMTKKGMAQLEKIDLTAVNQIENALTTLTKVEQNLLPRLLAEYSFGRVLANINNLTFRSECTDNERDQLREWFVRILLTDEIVKVPFEILHPRNRVISAWEITDTPTPIAIVEVCEVNQKVSEIVYFRYSTEVAENYFDLISIALQFLRRVGVDAETVKIPKEMQSALAFVDPRIFDLCIAR
jgi:DNA-binding MarR family transcriptional regulator